MFTLRLLDCIRCLHIDVHNMINLGVDFLSITYMNTRCFLGYIRIRLTCFTHDHYIYHMWLSIAWHLSAFNLIYIRVLDNFTWYSIIVYYYNRLHDLICDFYEVSGILWMFQWCPDGFIRHVSNCVLIVMWLYEFHVLIFVFDLWCITHLCSDYRGMFTLLKIIGT